MDSLIDILERLGFTNALWVFFAVIVVHEFEEWNISRFERGNFVGVPDTVNDRNAPGLTTAVLLVLPAGILLVAWAVRTGYASIWYAAAWAVPFGWALIDTVRAGNRMMPIIRGVYALANRIDRLFMKRAPRASRD